MGIHDREYYRNESGGHGLFGVISPVCNAIVVVNVLAFVIQEFGGLNPRVVDRWLAASADGIWVHGRVWQLLTATFLHVTPMHILGNMLFLWFLGREVESLYGSRDFLAFYLAAAVVSTSVWVAFHARSDEQFVHMRGASGAVMAVCVLYALYYPGRQILLYFFFPVPIWLCVALYLFWPLFDRSNIAVESHLAGAAFAVVYKYYDLRWARMIPRRLFSRTRLRIFSPTPHEKPKTRTLSPSYSATPIASASKSSSAAVLPEDQLNAQLDEVLAKIAREGRDRLTEEENRVLQEASRRARIKRSDRP